MCVGEEVCGVRRGVWVKVYGVRYGVRRGVWGEKRCVGEEVCG